jgi:hypothetical protein
MKERALHRRTDWRVGSLAPRQTYVNMDRDATVTAGSILISTVASLATISLLLTVFTK